MTDLNPCPFCGDTKAHGLHRPSRISRWQYVVMCGASSCGAEGPPAMSPQDAVSAWNARALPAVRAQFRTERDGIIGTTNAPIYSTASEDDGSITVEIDHWPEPAGAWVLKRPAPAAVPYATWGGWTDNADHALLFRTRADAEKFRESGIHPSVLGSHISRSDIRVTQDRVSGWVLWDPQHTAFWRAKSKGYTSDLRQAGVYEHSEAAMIAGPGDRGIVLLDTSLLHTLGIMLK